VIQVTMNCANSPKKNSKQRLCGGSWGNQIQIQHEDGSVAIYGHLDSRCAAKVSTGQSVSQGEQIGCMGQSGRATGSHLCFNLRKSANGSYINAGHALGKNYNAYIKKWERGFYSRLAQLEAGDRHVE